MPQLAFSLFHWILDLHGWVVLAVVFALPALEASAFVGFVFPGEIAVLLGGVLASRGRVSVVAVILVAFAGAVIGDSIGYWVGERWGRRILQATLGKFVKQEHFDRAEAFLARRGGPAVFVGRWTAALRVMVPGLAGMAGVRYRTFLLYNVTGGAAWATTFGVLGYAAGESYDKVAQGAGRAGLILLAIIVVIGAIALTGRWIARHPERVRARWDAFLELKPVTWTRIRLERPLAFLANRFRPGAALGLELTVGFVVIGLVGWGFGVVTQHVIEHTTGDVDRSVYRFFLDHRGGGTSTAMKVVTFFGGEVVLASIAVVVGLLWLWRTRSVRPLLLAFGAWVGAGILTDTVKALIDRPRPPAAHMLVHVSNASFPSGHVTESTAVYGMLAVLVAGAVGSWSKRVAVWVSAIVLVLLIAVSRLYLGVHWLTDVLGGFALGGMWLIAMLVTVRAVERAVAQRALRSAQSSGKNLRSSVVRR